MSPLWLAVLVVPAVADTAVRAVLAIAARRARGVARQPGRQLSILVLVPARAEGAAIAPTLRSLAAAGEGGTLAAVVVLDGPDPDAAAVCASFGVDCVVKAPAGPSKAAVLAWAAETLAPRLAACDAVVLLDVGSRLTPGFAAALDWPKGAAGVQAWLRGAGEGTGEAITLSERTAQSLEDRGREACGWSVRLRGTGTALTPEAFEFVAARLRTRVEDHEASLLLAASGRRLCMAGEGAAVIDDKPSGVADAARQRSRWLLGRWAVLLRHPGAVLRLALRRPAEGMAFVVETVSRPLSLTALLRVGVAGALLWLSRGSGQFALAAAFAGLAMASVVADLALLRLSGRLSLLAACRLVLAWIGAVAMAPLALLRWARVRRR